MPISSNRSVENQTSLVSRKISLLDGVLSQSVRLELRTIQPAPKIRNKNKKNMKQSVGLSQTTALLAF